MSEERNMICDLRDLCVALEALSSLKGVAPSRWRMVLVIDAMTKELEKQEKIRLPEHLEVDAE